MTADLIGHWIGSAWRTDGNAAPLIDPANGAETSGFKQPCLGRLHGREGLNDFIETKRPFSESGRI